MPIFRVLHPRGRATATLSSAPRKPFQRNNSVVNLVPLLSQIRQNFIDIHRVASIKRPLVRTAVQPPNSYLQSDYPPTGPSAGDSFRKVRTIISETGRGPKILTHPAVPAVRKTASPNPGAEQRRKDPRTHLPLGRGLLRSGLRSSLERRQYRASMSSKSRLCLGIRIRLCS